jgi:4-hydroxy-tetrahydrodipicolinate synthase
MPQSNPIHGVIPAALTPFNETGGIDDSYLRRHLKFLAQTPGVTGITVNGHAGEVASLTPEEQRYILRTARSASPAGKLVIAGIYAHSTREALELAAMAEGEGADALLIFPPEVWEFGVRERSAMAYEYYQDIASATALPMIAFVYPTASPLHLSTDIVLELCRRIPRIAAVKEWSNDMVVYEQTYRRLREEHPHVSLLSSYSRALVASLLIGADGILSGHGSLIADLHVRAFNAVASGDLAAAQRLAEVLHRLTEVFYAPPMIDAHTRMKVASVMLGRLSCPNVRKPLQPIQEHERARIAQAAELLSAETAPAKS